MVVGESRPETDCVGVRLRIKKVREEGFTSGNLVYQVFYLSYLFYVLLLGI